ncbi:hypothetical protein [Paracoccus pantotrophus]|uniref:hypothetical protein n=1 Tax=Paracoccus pantotrophus TaxID=82367 RepID=UPI0011CE0C78|nr:hypothetical protein [Paracoccus pantotrophus]
MEKVLAAGTARMTTGSRQGVIDGLEQAFLAEMLKYAGLGRVDKRDSSGSRPMIQAHLYVGDELGTQPDIRR